MAAGLIQRGGGDAPGARRRDRRAARQDARGVGQRRAADAGARQRHGAPARPGRADRDQGGRQLRHRRADAARAGARPQAPTVGKALADAGREAPRRSTPRSTSCAAAAPPTPPGAEDRYDALKKFARDLTEAARDGKLDPVIGRDEEIRRTIQILARRTKNNPVLIGEPGVGKTAIAEGLALRIANGDVPDSLKDRRLMSLDMGIADRRRQISRRVRGAAEGRARRGEAAPRARSSCSSTRCTR